MYLIRVLVVPVLQMSKSMSSTSPTHANQPILKLSIFSSVAALVTLSLWPHFGLKVDIICESNAKTGTAQPIPQYEWVSDGFHVA